MLEIHDQQIIVDIVVNIVDLLVHYSLVAFVEFVEVVNDIIVVNIVEVDTDLIVVKDIVDIAGELVEVPERSVPKAAAGRHSSVRHKSRQMSRFIRASSSLSG